MAYLQLVAILPFVLVHTVYAKTGAQQLSEILNSCTLQYYPNQKFVLNSCENSTAFPRSLNETIYCKMRYMYIAEDDNKNKHREEIHACIHKTIPSYLPPKGIIRRGGQHLDRESKALSTCAIELHPELKPVMSKCNENGNSYMGTLVCMTDAFVGKEKSKRVNNDRKLDDCMARYRANHKD